MSLRHWHLVAEGVVAATPAAARHQARRHQRPQRLGRVRRIAQLDPAPSVGAHEHAQTAAHPKCERVRRLAKMGLLRQNHCYAMRSGDFKQALATNIFVRCAYQAQHSIHRSDGISSWRADG